MERDRVTVGEAARRLGISESGIRKRIQRGQLDSTREDDGRVYVYLDTAETEEDDTVRDEVRDTADRRYVERLEDEIEFLRDQVRRQQEIIGQQAISLRALSAPETPSEAPSPGSEAYPYRARRRRSGAILAAVVSSALR